MNGVNVLNFSQGKKNRREERSNSLPEKQDRIIYKKVSKSKCHTLHHMLPKAKEFKYRNGDRKKTEQKQGRRTGTCCCFSKEHIKVTLTSFTFSLFSLPSYKLNL